jgi:hypothetical protein
MRRMNAIAVPVSLLRRLFSLMLMSMLSGAFFFQTPSLADDSLEYSVKGAFLFKFGEFVEWPPGLFASPTDPIVIGILGEDPFGSELNQIVDGHISGGRHAVVVRVRRADQLRNVHILFISQSERDHMDAVSASLQGKHILTVAEFEHPDVAITFVVENNRVQFDINLPAAEREGLKLSSKLLSVARNVRTGES